MSNVRNKSRDSLTSGNENSALANAIGRYLARRPPKRQVREKRQKSGQGSGWRKILWPTRRA